MNENLSGKKVAFLTTDGVEQVELTTPWRAVADAGGVPALVSPSFGEVQGWNHHDRGDRFAVDVDVSRASADDFDALVLPGGVMNGDAIRMDGASVAFVRDFFEQHKPVAAICHAPWILIEADVVLGRRLTSWPSLATDLRNAGGDWVDQEVVVDQGLVTSRNPDDLPAFTAKLLEEISEGVHAGQIA
ncbi:MAG: type 1 glutamine amidotransferase domain-containing protein [Leifsonia sp.]